MGKADGKTPLSAREQAALEYGGTSGGEFGMQDLDPQLKQELSELGLVPRWINAKQYLGSGNVHRSGWKAYRVKPKKDADIGGIDFTLGVSPEGYIIRNDLLLAVKTIESHEKYKAQVRKRTEAQEVTDAERAEEMRENARKAGVKARIYEGYDENET